MMFHFKRWLEDCGPVTGDYSNTLDGNSKLSQVRSKNMEGRKKPPKNLGDPQPDKLFGVNKKMKR